MGEYMFKKFFGFLSLDFKFFGFLSLDFFLVLFFRYYLGF